MGKLRSGRRAVALIWAWGLVALAGCGGPKLVPVSGKVTVGDQPLTTGRVYFTPDPAKGNTSRVICIGPVNDQGHYVLQTTGITPTETGKGAPPGWYKVTVRHKGGPGELRPPVNADYLDDNKTPLSVEVVVKPKPGRYDFKLTGP
jgi:hypothetical protein